MSTKAVKAPDGYDTTSLISKANSDPKIEMLAKKEGDRLMDLYIKRLEWSLHPQEQTLQSIKYVYSDGTQSALFGKKEATTA